MIAMFLIGMLACMAQAIAISKSDPASAAPSVALTERDVEIRHDWALVCAYDRHTTDFCNRRYGYGCDSAGRLFHVLYEHSCEMLCTCFNIAPKPVCIFGVSGQSYCNRNLNEKPDPRLPQENADMANGEKEAEPILLNQETHDQDAIGPQDRTTDQLPVTGTGSQHQEQDLFQTAHQWAMVCNKDRLTAADCSSEGYFCDSAGHIQGSGNDRSYCIDACVCIDILADDGCFTDAGGAVYCLSSTARTDLTIAQTSGTVSSHLLSFTKRDESTAQIPHNWAMVCADDKQETIWCQNDGYYCDSNGKIRCRDVPSKYCSDYCVCIDVGLKMFCVMQSNGAMHCLRSLADEENHLPELLSDTGSPGIQAEETEKQSAEPDVVTDVDNEQVHKNEPRTESVAEWPSNDYAMVCWNDKDLSTFCASEYHYFCSSTGKLDQQEDGVKSYSCEENCKCMNLNPKPVCIVSLTGMAQCARDAHKEGCDVEISAPLSAPHAEDSNSVDGSADGCFSQTASRSMLTTASEDLGSADVYAYHNPTTLMVIERSTRTLGQERDEADVDAQVNHYAMVCYNDRYWSLTVCSGEHGYYCNADGDLNQKEGKPLNVACEMHCECVNMNPKPNCILLMNGVLQCA